MKDPSFKKTGWKIHPFLTRICLGVRIRKKLPLLVVTAEIPSNIPLQDFYRNLLGMFTVIMVENYFEISFGILVGIIPGMLLWFIQKFLLEFTTKFCWDSSGISLWKLFWNSWRITGENLTENGWEILARISGGTIKRLSADTLREAFKEILVEIFGRMACGISIGLVVR